MNLDGYVLNVFTNSFFTSPPDGVESIAVSVSVCFYVCMSARIFQKLQHFQTL